MNASKIFNVCVIGGGVNGSSAAYSLAKRGKNVLLLEQYPVPHTRGSSHGQTRVVRCYYPSEIYGRVSRDSFPLWRTLEKEVKEQLLIQNGYLELYDTRDPKEVPQCMQVLEKLNVKYEVLSGEEINRRFPLFDVPTTYSGIYEPGGGTVMASKAVLKLQVDFVFTILFGVARLTTFVSVYHYLFAFTHGRYNEKVFQENGGTFRDGEQVLNIVPGSTVKITTSTNQYEANSLIVTAGPYTSKLTRALGLNLPLKVERTHACYWKIKNGNHGSTVHGFPTFFGSRSIYGLAAHEYPGLIKICDHFGTEMNIDEPKDITPDPSSIQTFIKGFMKDVSLTPSVIEPCHYTITPDRGFIIDVHPIHKNIVVGAGFSGGGFKMAPVTGQILADLATGNEPSYDISAFKMSRFKDVYCQAKL